MPIDGDGQYKPHPKDEEAARVHPLMPPPSLLRKVGMIVHAAGVVVHEVEHQGGKTERMQRALASIISWHEDPQVVAWIEAMFSRGEISRDFLK